MTEYKNLKARNQFSDIEDDYKRLISLNKHVENLFKLKSKKIYNSEKIKINDKK